MISYLSVGNDAKTIRDDTYPMKNQKNKTFTCLFS